MIKAKRIRRERKKEEQPEQPRRELDLSLSKNTSLGQLHYLGIYGLNKNSISVDYSRSTLYRAWHILTCVVRDRKWRLDAKDVAVHFRLCRSNALTWII